MDGGQKPTLLLLLCWSDDAVRCTVHFPVHPHFSNLELQRPVEMTCLPVV